MDKISPIKQNILYYIEYKGITKLKFCELTDISYSNLKGKGLLSEIGGDQVGKILHIFPEINPEWLITGKGEMLKEISLENRKFDKIEDVIEALLSHTITKYEAIMILKKWEK